MALRVNSKKARENARRWIMEKGFNPEFASGNRPLDNFENIAVEIWENFERATASMNYPRNTFSRFEYWVSGLPGVLDSGAWLLGYGAARDFVSMILEETEDESAGYDSAKSERVAAVVIFGTLTDAVESYRRKQAKEL